MVFVFAFGEKKPHLEKKKRKQAGKQKKRKNNPQIIIDIYHNGEMFHSDFHLPDIHDNSTAAGNSAWEADFQAKQTVGVDRWNEKWVVSLMSEKAQKHPDQSFE